MTFLEAIQRSVDFLAKKGVDSPRLQAELLLAHVLQIPRMKLYLDFERELAAPQLSTFRELLRRRGQREPLQHLLGTVNFCGLELVVTPDVLIPRPETEQLAELAWQSLASPQATVLDFGTGSGCLAIAIAVHCPAAKISALDISEPALDVARRNAGARQVSDRITFIQSDRFAALPAGASFDLIVSNPPYIPIGDIPTLQPEVRDHDPRAALDGGPDGLDFYRWLAAEAGNHLNSGGRLLVEFGDGQADALRQIFELQKWIVESIAKDYAQRQRFLAARR